MKTRAPSRSKSWFKLHYGIHQAMSSVGKNRVCSTIGNSVAVDIHGGMERGVNSVTLYAYDAAD